jgi:hypothetical protein
VTFDEFCERLHRLRPNRSGGLVKPYKPLMVAAVVILIHKGKITSRNVLLDGGLKSVFFQLLALLYPAWPKSTKAEYPFRHLENDRVWRLVPIEGASEELRAAKSSKAEAWVVLRHVRCAEMDEEVFLRLATRSEDRIRVLEILARTYFPADTADRLWNLVGDRSEVAQLQPDRVAEGSADTFTERALEEHLATHWHETPFAGMGVELSRVATTGLPGRQVLTEVNSIDLLGFHPQRRQWWVFELKRGRPNDAVVGQVSRYLGWVQEERSQDGRSAVGAIIARDVDRKLRLAVKPHPALSLWQFDEHLRLHPVT